MPLSAREQKIIHDIEDALTLDDPRLAKKLNHYGSHRHYPRLTILGLLSVLVGTIVMIVSLNIHGLLLGAVAFLMMTGGIYTASIPLSRGTTHETRVPPPSLL